MQSSLIIINMIKSGSGNIFCYFLVIRLGLAIYTFIVQNEGIEINLEYIGAQKVTV